MAGVQPEVGVVEPVLGHRAQQEAVAAGKAEVEQDGIGLLCSRDFDRRRSIVGSDDIVSIGDTVLNQSGQALEVISIFMVFYLTISLLTSAFMNWYNQRIKLVER